MVFVILCEHVEIELTRPCYGPDHKWGAFIICWYRGDDYACSVSTVEMSQEKVLKNIFLSHGHKAQLSLPWFQPRSTRHVEWEHQAMGGVPLEGQRALLEARSHRFSICSLANTKKAELEEQPDWSRNLLPVPILKRVCVRRLAWTPWHTSTRMGKSNVLYFNTLIQSTSYLNVSK